MNHQSSRANTFRSSFVHSSPLAPTCYIQSTITGQCATRPVFAEPSLRGAIEMYSGAGLVPGATCGYNTGNAGLPCLGGYCSDFYKGTCVRSNALADPNVNLYYVNYGSRM